MPRWTVDAPTALELDDVTEVHVRLIGGTVAVLASDDQPALAVSQLSGRPLLVSLEEGVLTVTYESLSWDGLLGFLKPRKDNAAVTITVPESCPVQLGVLSASAVVAGLHAGAEVKGMSGDITLEGVTGEVRAETMSGEVAACDIDGEVRFRSMSGKLTLAGGAVGSLDVNTMSGEVTADVTLRQTGGIDVSTMSGDVALRLPADSDAQVRLQSASGAVRTEFDSLRAVKAPASHTVSGNVGAGTGHVSVTTMSGSVTLLRRQPVGMESKTQ